MADPQGQAASGSRCIVIPARFASTRFPGKPLALLRGAGGIERPLIEWTWRTACSVADAGPVFVATDDLRIAEEVARFGGKVLLTPPECANGTERCAAVLDQLPADIDVVVNLQGDNPLTPPTVVEALMARMAADPSIAVTTPAILASGGTREHLLDEQRSGRVGGTTVVFDREERALYFSKAVLPHGATANADIPIHLHLGVYAYRRAALQTYRAAPPSAAEQAEGLEQLRFLDQGVPVTVVVVPAPDGTMVELNNPADRAVIESEFARRGME